MDNRQTEELKNPSQLQTWKDLWQAPEDTLAYVAVAASDTTRFWSAKAKSCGAIGKVQKSPYQVSNCEI